MAFDHTWKLAVWVILIRQIAGLSNKALQQHHSMKLITASVERHLPVSCGRAWRMQQMRSPGLKQPAVTIHTKRPALHSPMGPTVKCTMRAPRRATSALPLGTGVRAVALQGEECEKRLYLLLVSQHFCRLDSAPFVVEFSHWCSATDKRRHTHEPQQTEEEGGPQRCFTPLSLTHTLTHAHMDWLPPSIGGLSGAIRVWLVFVASSSSSCSWRVYSSLHAPLDGSKHSRSFNSQRRCDSCSDWSLPRAIHHCDIY